MRAALAVALLVGWCGSRPEHASTVEHVRELPKGVHGLAFAGDGTLFFSDSYGTRKVFAVAAPWSGAARALELDVQRPAGLLATAEGLFVADVDGDAVLLVADAGTRRWSVAAPWNVSALGGRAWAVTFDGALVELMGDGGTAVERSGLAAPFGLLVEEDGAWLSEQRANRVAKWLHDGGVLEVARRWNNPEGLARRDGDALYVADTAGNELVRVSSRGAEVVTRAPLPVCVAVFDGGVFFTQANERAGLYRLVR